MRITDYIFYFFFYSFIGWFFESCYCSFKPKKWINRGFLRGPLCPIYGTGALVIILTLIPLRSATSHPYLNELLIFAVGMIVCDTVEFATSYIMEKLFNARWWDYSGMRFNIQGRICLTHTLYWGTASCIFCYVLHPIIDLFVVKQVSETSRDILVYIILTVFFFDLLDTVINALGIRKFSVKFKKISDDVAGFAEKAYSTMGDKFEKLTEDKKAELENDFNDLRNRYAELKKETNERKNKTKTRLVKAFPRLFDGLKRHISVIEELFEDLKEKFNNYKN